MAVTFPSSPVNGQTYSANGQQYTYNAEAGIWDIAATPATSTTAGGLTMSDSAPSNPAVGDQWFNTELLETYVWYSDVHGSYWVKSNPTGATEHVDVPTDINDLTDTSGVIPADVSDLTDSTSLLGSGGASVSVISGTENFPANADSSTGDLVYETDSNKLFIYNGTGWDSLQATQNQAPTWSPSTTNFNLSNDGTPTVVNLTATDPEGIPLVYSYTIDSGDSNIATVSLSGNTLTVTPTTDDTISGSFNLSVLVADNSGNSLTQPFNFSLSWGLAYAAIYQENTSGTNGNAYRVGTSFGAGVDNSEYEFTAGTYKYFLLGEGGNGGWSHYQGGGSGYATIGQFTATSVWRLHAIVPEFRTTANENINSDTNKIGVSSGFATQFRAISTVDSTQFADVSAQPGYPGGKNDSSTDADGTSGGGGAGNAGAGGAGGSGGNDGVNGTTNDSGNGIGTSQFESRRAHLESMLQTVDSGATVTAGAGGAPSAGTSHGGGGGGGGFLVAGSSILPNKNGEPGATVSAKTPGQGGQGWGAGGGATGYDGSRGVGGFGTGGLVVVVKV